MAYIIDEVSYTLLPRRRRLKKGNAMESLAKYLAPQDVPLGHIFLDPNNPRFTGTDWIYVPDSVIANDEIQQLAQKRLVKEFGVEKLRSNMEVNGYLPIDRVVVRKFTSDNYVVLEGNRRICAARMIGEFDTDGGKIPDEVRDTLHTIPVLVYTGDNESNEAAWIFQGLRHITGNVDWSAFNKAKLLVEQMEEEGVSQTEVGRRFGLTGYGAGQWVRGFHAFRQARTETEYGAAIDERIYPYIQEIFGRSSIPVREWLEWDEGVKKFKNIANFNEFVGWFYSREESGEEATFTEPSPSDWDKRMIGKRDDIRQIGFLIQNSPSDFASFRQNGDVEAAYSRAQMARLEKQQVDRAEELFDAIEECTQAIENAPLSVMKDDAKKSKLADLLVKLQTAMQLIQ